MTTNAQNNHADLNPEKDWIEVIPGERFKIRTSAIDTEGLYTILELIAEPRNGVPLHIHANEEETFVVLEGSLHLANGERRLDLSVGEASTVARGTAHAWCNISDSNVRFLVIFSPGNIERTFRRIGALSGQDVTAISQTAEDDGSAIVGPPLFDNIYSIMSPRPGH